MTKLIRRRYYKWNNIILALNIIGAVFLFINKDWWWPYVKDYVSTPEYIEEIRAEEAEKVSNETANEGGQTIEEKYPIKSPQAIKKENPSKEITSPGLPRIKETGSATKAKEIKEEAPVSTIIKKNKKEETTKSSPIPSPKNTKKVSPSRQQSIEAGIRQNERKLVWRWEDYAAFQNTYFPIIVISDRSFQKSLPLDDNWYYRFSTIDEFLQMSLISGDQYDEFIANHKDYRSYYCIYDLEKKRFFNLKMGV